MQFRHEAWRSRLWDFNNALHGVLFLHVSRCRVSFALRAAEEKAPAYTPGAWKQLVQWSSSATDPSEIGLAQHSVRSVVGLSFLGIGNHRYRARFSIAKSLLCSLRWPIPLNQ